MDAYRQSACTLRGTATSDSRARACVHRKPQKPFRSHRGAPILARLALVAERRRLASETATLVGMPLRKCRSGTAGRARYCRMRIANSSVHHQRLTPKPNSSAAPAAPVSLIGIRAFSRMATKRRKPRPADRAGLWGRRLTRRSSCGCATRSGCSPRHPDHRRGWRRWAR